MKRLALLFISLCMLSGCAAAMKANGVFDGYQSNLKERSYAAADMLVQQTRNVVMYDTPLEIGIITEVNTPGVYTAFGRMLASQVGGRFVQLGYNVTTLSYQGMTSAQQSVMEPSMQDAQAVVMPNRPASRVIITGNYAIASKDVFINLHLIEVDTGRILAAYDYSLPLSSDIKALTKIEGEERSLFSF